MNWSLLKTEKNLMALVISSIAIFPSLFISAKIAGIVLLVWVLIVGWNVAKLFGLDFLSSIGDKAWEKGLEGAKDKDYMKAGVHFIVVPVMAVGLIMVILQLFVLIFLM